MKKSNFYTIFAYVSTEKISIFLSIMKKHSDYIRILTLLVGGDTMPKIKKRKFRNFGNFDIIDNQK